MSRLGARIRKRFDFVPGEQRPHPGRVGSIGLVVLTAVVVIAFTGRVPFVGQAGRLVRAEFKSADQLVSGRTPVRVHGVPVGTVDHVEAGPTPDTATVVMRITNDHVRLARDASAAIRLRTVIGGTRYVDLDPGSQSAPPLGDDAIPVARTSSQVDWDDFNQPYTADARAQQRRLFRGLSSGFAAPASIGQTLHVLGPALDVVGRGADAARGSQAGDLQRLVRATGVTLDALSKERGALQGLIAGGQRTLATTAAHRQALGQAVELSPPALAASTTTMNRLRVTLDHLDPLVADLRPGARRLAAAASALRPGLDESERLLRASVPLLHETPPTLTDLAAASRAGVPTMNGLQPTLARLDQELLPFLRRTDPSSNLRNYEAIGPFISIIDSSAAEFTPEGHLYKFTEGVSSDMVPCTTTLQPPAMQRCSALNDVLSKLFGAQKK